MTPRHPAFFAALVALLPLVPAGASARPATQEVVTEVRIHGNYRTPDDEVLRIAEITPGSPLGAGGIEAAAGRLRASGRFDAVDVRTRYRSLTDDTQIAVIIVIQERPGVEKGGVMPGPLKRVRNAVMASPTFDYTDGYGVTAGGRLSFVNVLGKEGHVVVPLAVGSTRMAAVELDKTLRSGPARHVQAGAAIASRENPAYDMRDRRAELTIAGSRPLGSFVNVNARAGWSDVAFGGIRDRFVSYGAGVALDTRANPAFPRNAVYLSAGWDVMRPDSGPAVNRYTLDARAYAGLIGSAVLALRAKSETADGPLPIYERRLLGGFSSLRGFRAGAFSGDNAAFASVELRVPFHSPMHMGQSGLTLFADAGAAYDRGTKLSDAGVHRGFGAGWYLRAPLVQIEVDVAHGIDRSTRVHVNAGLRF